MGADKAIHMTDMAFAGSDTLATSRTIALAIQRNPFDLILCGRNSNDAETGQVGPEIAEILHIPHVSNARKLDFVDDGQKVLVERVTDQGYETIRCPLPALVTVAEGISEEKFASKAELDSVQDEVVEEIGAGQLWSDQSLFGTIGSPTRVEEIRLIEPDRLGVTIEDTNPKEAARRVVAGLRDRLAARPTGAKRVDDLPRHKGNTQGAIWVMTEVTGSELRRVTFEMIGKARELVQRTQGEIVAVLLGQGVQEHVKAVAAFGADRALILGSDVVAHPASRSAAVTLAKAMADRRPYAVLIPSTINGRDLAGRVAARLGLGLTGDCIDLETNENGELVQLKPALGGGNVVAPILSRTRPYMATMRPGLLDTLDPNWDLDLSPEYIEWSGGELNDIEILGVHSEEDAEGLELETARVVLAVGMGAGSPENIPTIEALAQSIGASLAATRDVTDAGWLPKQIQVGLTGRAISPELYIAVGIRGDFNHMVGIQKAGTIVGINNNPNPRRTPILHAADFCIVGDWQSYLAPLVESLRELLHQS